MSYCKKCGAPIDDGAAFCSSCGAAQGTATPTPTPTPAVTDDGGFGWGVLGCCLPIVGLILFLVWKDTKPKTSKAAGIGALVGVIATVALYFIGAVLGATAGMM